MLVLFMNKVFQEQEIYNLLKSDEAKNEFIQYVKNNFKRYKCCNYKFKN